MGFFKYPYTDLNELNLDWVIAKIKYIEQAKNIIFDNSGTPLISNNVQDVIDEIYTMISTQGVTSFNGRSGVVSPEAGDYIAAQVTYDNTTTGYTATDVQAAIDEADAKIETVSQSVPVTYVETFNSRSGAVTPAAGDYNGAQVAYDNSQSGLTATDLQAAVDELAAAPGGVTSFNNRTGAVVPAASDYTATQVDFDDTVAQTGSSNVQGALQYVATRGSSAALTTYDNTQSGLTATNVQAAIDEVANDVLSSGVASFNGRTGAVSPQTGDYDGSQVDYDNTVSGLTATSVQAAIDELAGSVSPPAGWYMTAIETISNNNTTDTMQARLKDLADQLKLKFESLAVDERYVITGFDRGGLAYPYLGLSFWDSSASAGKGFKRIVTTAASNVIEAININQTLGNCSYFIWTSTTTGNTVTNNTTATYNQMLSIQLVKYKQVI